MIEELKNRLSQIDDPVFKDDIISLGLVGDITVKNGEVHVPLALGSPYAPHEKQIADQVREAVDKAGYEPVLTFDMKNDTPEGQIEDTPNVIAVSSGKGGVGKTTVAVNLATSIAQHGAHVGLFDADVYGPNIPRMLGVHDRPAMAEDDETIIPLERNNVKVMSIGFLVDDDDPVIWRGPMVDKILTQLWEDTKWGDLNYVLIDLPPGTGDAQLTMLQKMPVFGTVIVTTPQDVALDDARKGIQMFEQHDTEILGIVENMSTFVCPDCGNTHDIFDAGGGERLAKEFDHSLLAEIPLDPLIRETSEAGEPITLQTDTQAAMAFNSFAEEVMNRVGRLQRQSYCETN